MTVVGALARIDLRDTAAVRGRLAGIEGVELFELDEPGRVGLVVESDGVDAAREVLDGVVARVEGVLGVWPVYVNVEEEGVQCRVRAGFGSPSVTRSRH